MKKKEDRKRVTVAVHDAMKDADLSHYTSAWQRNVVAVEIEEEGVFSDLMVESHGLLSRFYRQMFSELYDGELIPMEQPSPDAEWSLDLQNKLRQAPDYSRLKRECLGLAWQTGMASSNLSEYVKKLIPDPPEKTPEQIQEEMEKMQQAGAKENSPIMQALEQQKQAAQQQMAKMIAAIQADDGAGIAQAVQKAAQGAEEMRDKMLALGAGNGQGELTPGDVPPPELIESLKNNKQIKEIAKLAGQLQIGLSRTQARRDADAPEEYYRVGLSGDLARAIPAELQQIADLDLETMALLRMVEGRMISYDQRGRPPQNMGPLVVCVDESGSMNGQRTTLAKAALIALAAFAAKRRRHFAVVHFDSRVSRVNKMRGKPTGEQLMSMLQSTGGGTDIAAALSEAHKLLAGDYDRADVLLITDGEDNPETVKRQIDALHKRKARVFALTVDSDDEFRKMFDRSYELSSDLTSMQSALVEAAVV